MKLHLNKINKSFSILILMPLFMSQSCTTSKVMVDLIVHNATIYTIDHSGTKAESIAINKGIIVEVGGNEEIGQHFSATKSIDASGLYIYPGFIDAHSHFSGFAEYLRYADLSQAKSYEEMIKIIVDYHSAHPNNWIVGRGWDQNKWKNKKFPESHQIDQMFPDIPVVLSRVDGHAILANQAALREAGLSEPFPQGEAILEDGKPIGVYLEHTAEKIKLAIPPPSNDEMIELINNAAKLCQSVGLSGVNDAGIDKNMILLIDSLLNSGKLKLRIDAMINPSKENMDFFMDGKNHSSDWLRVQSVKIYADGALGSRGACLLQPYKDEPSTQGLIVTGMSEMKSICKRAMQSGFQVNTHAIGDSAVRMVLEVYSKFLNGMNDKRWRIEHAQVVDKNDFKLFKKYSVIPSVQATHATSDQSWAIDRLGEERLKCAYAYRNLKEQNGWIANGTDFAVESIHPLRTFYAAVFRKDLVGNPSEGFLMENSLSRMDALKSITIWAAKAAFEESKRGSIEKGKFADIVVLDKDLLLAPESEILKSKVKLTIIDGQIVYESKQ